MRFLAPEFSADIMLERKCMGVFGMDRVNAGGSGGAWLHSSASDSLAGPPVSVIGLGHDGVALMAHLADLGVRAIGADISRERVEAIRAGERPGGEPFTCDRFEAGITSGLLEVTRNLVAAVLETRVTLVTVEVSTLGDGGEWKGLLQVSRSIGQAIGLMQRRHLVILHSAVPPDVCDVVALEIEKASGKRFDLEFEVVSNCQMPTNTGPAMPKKFLHEF